MKSKTPSQLTLAAFNQAPAGVDHVCRTVKPKNAAALITSPDRLMRRSEVQQVTGLSRTTLYRLIAAKDFPQQIRLSINSVAWLSSSVQAWIAGRVAESATSAKSPAKAGR